MAEVTKNESNRTKLQNILQEYLHNWSKPSIKFPVLFIVSINKVLIVNFVKLSRGFDTKSKNQSNLRRIQRFMSSFELCFESIAKLTVALLPIKGPFVLSMDRTNWKFGTTDINILMLSICWQSVSVPVVWRLLPKRGNSDTAERIVIMERYIRLFGLESIQYFTADREFIGNKWFNYLTVAGIKFCIRVKENAQIINRNGKKIAVYKFFSFLRNNQKHTNNKQQKVYGTRLWISAVKRLDENRRSELVIVVSNYKKEDILEDYAKRRQIECMFKAMKSSGYNLEDTHLTELDRIKKLIALVSVTFLWAYMIGDWLNKEVEPIKIKKHGRRAHSVFAYGLDYLSSCLLNEYRNLDDCLKILSCT